MCQHSSHQSSGTICNECATTPLTSEEGAHINRSCPNLLTRLSLEPYSGFRAFGISRPHPPKTRIKGCLSSSTIHPTVKTVGSLVETYVKPKSKCESGSETSARTDTNTTYPPTVARISSIKPYPFRGKTMRAKLQKNVGSTIDMALNRRSVKNKDA